jgi:hypothetical protein
MLMLLLLQLFRFFFAYIHTRLLAECAACATGRMRALRSVGPPARYRSATKRRQPNRRGSGLATCDAAIAAVL